MFEMVLMRNDSLFKKSIVLENLADLYSSSDIVEELSSFNIPGNVLNHLSNETKILVPFNDGEDFIYQYISEKSLNYFTEDCLGKHFKQIFPKLINLGVYDLLKEVYLTGNEINFIIEIFLDEVLTNSFSNVLFKEEGMIFSISEDTTEISLLNPAERQIYDSTVQGVIELKSNGEVTRFNKTAQNLTGYSVHDLNEIGIMNCISDQNNFNPEIKSSYDVLEKLRANEILFSDSEIKIRVKDGGEKWFKSHTNKLKRHKHIIQSTFFDITPRKLAEEEASLLRKNLEISQRISKSGNFFVNESGKFVYTRGIYNILEKTFDENDKDKNLILDALIPQDKLKLKEIYSNLNENNPNAIYEGKIKLANGKIKYIKIYSTKVISSNDKFTINCFVQDITNQTIAKMESIKLKEALDMIKPKSHFAINWWNDELNYEATSTLFDILETEAPKDFKYENDILLDFISSKDIPKFKKEYAKFLNCEINELELNLEIISGENNKKYIYIYKKAIDEFNGHLKSYVGYIQDITEQKLLEHREHDYFDKSIQGLGIIKDYQFIRVNDKFSEIVDVPKEKIINKSIDFNKYSIGGITESEYLDMASKIQNKSIYFYDSVVVKYKRQWIKFHMVPTEYMGEPAILITLIDVTEEVLKEKELDESKKEKELLLSEIHDRVKNNLQIISSLLRLGEKFDPNSSGSISKDTVQRIDTLALVHENAYDYDRLTQINIKKFIQNQLEYLIVSNNCSRWDINLVFEIDSDLFVPIEYMTHLSLITNEIFNNALIYAFSDDDGINKKIYCNFSIDHGTCKLLIKDNGRGLPEDLDINDPKTLSFTIIGLLIKQLEGNISQLSGSGAGFYIEFPVNV